MVSSWNETKKRITFVANKVEDINGKHHAVKVIILSTESSLLSP